MTEIHLPEQLRQDITAMRIVERRSFRQIGAAYGHSEEWAKRRCLALGLPRKVNVKPPRRRPLRPVDEILALRARGMSMTEIARALGISKNAVIGRLWRAGECRPKQQALPPMLDFVALVERIPHTGCRYIAAREPRLHEGMYCCRPCLVVERHGKPERSSYCPEHHALTHLRPAPLPAEARHAD